ncbi:uncharacterized protein Z518_01426 [Rhinocladiella mackenziei CBS 650.93]|uniref:Rhinocladiella mackenziei CBS 650.93 unplaced genomic scaffold supercont1.1, whole genome shotgun sequence n=1 Tax=Rhinocladiella mackenziei CBS 650.93 TaxID=1442369 RepID=A0A0D2IWF1_9EURO|nr:uncharacterized protein Z518_01426 [Rhinocladiella mackenziei CBS 650.93]KIX10344.1 hypothetical protein Z518_01426 [Rhinocladiella mackenziei CBS 650.93]
MAPTTRKKSFGSTQPPPAIFPDISSPLPAGFRPKSKDDDPFEQTFNPFNDDPSDHDSDHSEFGKVRAGKRKKSLKSKEDAKKRKFQIMRRHDPAPELPDLSDEEVIPDSEHDEKHHGVLSVNRQSAPASGKDAQLPPVISIQVNSTTDRKIVVNLSLADLLMPTTVSVPESSIQTSDMGDDPGLEMEGNTLVGGTQKPTYAGFLDLPEELRRPIYRNVFCGPPVDFDVRTDFGRSSALLRICKIVHEEGRKILYGENSFHFARSEEMRGKYWEQHWKEVGYKDIRRFLQTIGPANISNMKFVSFSLSDGTEKHNPGVDLEDRRFVNDPTLHHIFRLIGANANLHKLAVQFAGRSQVLGSDFHFMRAFAEMKCNKLVIFSTFRGRYNRMSYDVKDKLKSAMVMKFENEEQLDSKKKAMDKVKGMDKVKMVYEDVTYVSIIRD